MFAAPALTEVTLRLVRAGAGLLMRKTCGAVVPPPGAGETTVTSMEAGVPRNDAGTGAESCAPLTHVVVSAVVPQ